MIIYFLKNYNNYYNRIIKRESTLADYITAVGSNGYTKRGTSAIVAGGYGPVNFNINDGITADVTYNYIDGQDWEPDYVLCVNDADDTILYRFFVMEAVRTRKYQYRLTLRRDIVADNYDNVINAPMYIEKATIPSTNDPFIFNKEGNTYNQIKDQNELLLKDDTKSAWYVGYVATNKIDNTQGSSTPGSFSGAIATTPDFEFTTAQMNTFKSTYLNDGDMGIIWRPTDWLLIQNVMDGGAPNYGEQWRALADGSLWSGGTRGSYGTTNPSSYYHFKTPTYPSGSQNSRMSFWAGVWRTNWQPNLTSAIRVWLGAHSNTDVLDNSYVTTAITYNNKIIHDTTANKYYRIQVDVSSEENILTNAYSIPNNNSETEDQELYDALSVYNLSTIDLESNAAYDNTSTILAVKRASEYQVARFALKEITSPQIEVRGTLENTIKYLNDAPYAMFAIPANGFTTKYKKNNIVQTFTSDPNTNLAAALGIASLGESLCYDVQLLPYCPIMSAIKMENNTPVIDVTGDAFVEDVNYTVCVIGGTANEATLVLWANESTGTFDITHATEYSTNEDKLLSSELTVTDTPEDLKIENETSFYRMVSPNYSGAFDFSVAKNGTVNYVNIDYQYKPYQPYIHINPNFKYMYGADTNDARGLVCAGDFSIPTVTDQWKQFEINNKNYQKSFDRQIESMDTLHEYDKEERNWKALAGVIGGAAGGATMGAKAGIGGALAGGGVGLIAGTVGATIDWRLQESRFSEQKSYAIDNFNLSLGNIKARPDILTKVSAYNPNNKIWPFIEHYHATEAEVNALREQLKYNGMTVNKIGKIQDYLQSDYSFIRGKLIRLENSGLEFHEQMQLAQELQEGVYIK